MTLSASSHHMSSLGFWRGRRNRVAPVFGCEHQESRKGLCFSLKADYNTKAWINRSSDFSHGKEYFWTDSKVVLGYINNDALRFHTFVAYRVQKICHSTSPQQWLYVSTDENPADGAHSTGSPVSCSSWKKSSTRPTHRKSRSQKDMDAANIDHRTNESCQPSV